MSRRSVLPAPIKCLVSGSGKRRWSIRSPPRPSAAVVMWEPGSPSAGVRRRDGGAINTRRTDSHDPRITKGRPIRAALSSKAFFSFGPAAARFLFLQKEKMGGGSLRQSRASGGRSLLKPSPSSGGNAAGYAGTTPTSPLPSSGPLRRPPSPIGGRLSRAPFLTPAFGGSAAAPRRRCPPPIPAGWRREWRKWWCCVALPDPRPSPAAPGTAAPATAPRPGPWGRPY